MYNELRSIKLLIQELERYNKTCPLDDKINFHPISFPLKLKYTEILWRQVGEKDYEPKAIWISSESKIMSIKDLMGMSDVELAQRIAPTPGGGELANISARVQQIYREIDLLPSILEQHTKYNAKQLEEVKRLSRKLLDRIRALRK